MFVSSIREIPLFSQTLLELSEKNKALNNSSKKKSRRVNSFLTFLCYFKAIPNPHPPARGACSLYFSLTSTDIFLLYHEKIKNTLNSCKFLKNILNQLANDLLPFAKNACKAIFSNKKETASKLNEYIFGLKCNVVRGRPLAVLARKLLGTRALQLASCLVRAASCPLSNPYVHITSAVRPFSELLGHAHNIFNGSGRTAPNFAWSPR